MKVSYGAGPTQYGPGVLVELTGTELAVAIQAYLVAHEVYISGPSTVHVNGELCDTASVYVDPSGFLVCKGERWSGRGPGK